MSTEAAKSGEEGEENENKGMCGAVQITFSTQNHYITQAGQKLDFGFQNVTHRIEHPSLPPSPLTNLCKP